MKAHLSAIPLSRLLGVALSLGATGCYSTWDIAPGEIARLHGYRAPVARVIPDKEGDDVPVDAATELHFHSVARALELEEKFDSIDIDARGGERWLSGARHGDGKAIRVDLTQVIKVEATRYSPGKTAAVVVPTVVLSAALIAGIVFASALSGVGQIH